MFAQFGFTADHVRQVDRGAAREQRNRLKDLTDMAIKVGINGYGRIGRNVLRALYEAGAGGEIQIVALNDLGRCRRPMRT